jgi:hypothetical protein
MDGRIAGADEIVTDDLAKLGAMAAREILRRLGQARWQQITGRRIDEIAAEENGFRLARHARAIGLYRPNQLRRGTLARLVAGESIGAERPAEREPCRLLRFRLLGEPVGALRQRLRQAGEAPDLAVGRTCRRIEPDQQASRLTVATRNDEQRAGIGRIACRLDLGTLGI